MNPRKSTARKIVAGNPGKRPLFAIPNFHKPKTIPEPPAGLSIDGACEWRRVAGELWRANLLSTVDLPALYNYCLLVGITRRCAKVLEGGKLTVQSQRSAPRAHPALKIIQTNASLILNFSDRFGLNPRARGQVDALPGDQKPQADPFERLMNMGSQGPSPHREEPSQ
jgi:P27 family predicted phage terminase small subunit